MPIEFTLQEINIDKYAEIAGGHEERRRDEHHHLAGYRTCLMRSGKILLYLIQKEIAGSCRRPREEIGVYIDPPLQPRNKDLLL